MKLSRLLSRSSDPSSRPTLGRFGRWPRLPRWFRGLPGTAQQLPIAAFLALVILSHPARGDESGEFAVDLGYPTFGIAPQPARIGFIPMKSGQEEKFATWAIVNGLKNLGNVIENVSLETLIEPEEEWTTQISQLNRETTDEYNQALTDSTMKLRQDYIYGVQYSGEYAIVSDQLRFSIITILYQRGRSTEYIPNTDSLNVEYFFERAKASINDELVRLVNENPPQ